MHYQFLAFSKLRRRYIYFGTSSRDLFKTQVSNDLDFPLGKKSHDSIPSVYDHFYLLKITRRKKVLKRSEEVILQKKMSESMDLKDVPTCIHKPIVAEFWIRSLNIFAKAWSFVSSHFFFTNELMRGQSWHWHKNKRNVILNFINLSEIGSQPSSRTKIRFCQNDIWL